MPRMRPRCSVFAGGFAFSGCLDCTSCPPFEAEMSNSDASAIVLQGVPCTCGLYKFRFEWRKRLRSNCKRLSSPAQHVDDGNDLATSIVHLTEALDASCHLRVNHSQSDHCEED